MFCCKGSGCRNARISYIYTYLYLYLQKYLLDGLYSFFGGGNDAGRVVFFWKSHMCHSRMCQLFEGMW